MASFTDSDLRLLGKLAKHRGDGHPAWDVSRYNQNMTAAHEYFGLTADEYRAGMAKMEELGVVENVSHALGDYTAFNISPKVFGVLRTVEHEKIIAIEAESKAKDARIAEQSAKLKVAWIAAAGGIIAAAITALFAYLK